MAIRKRKGATGIAYQVYWKNPYTGAQQCKTFPTLAEARKHDSLVKHKIRFETEDFRPTDIPREGADRTVEDAVFLYLKDKRFPTADTATFLVALRRPLDFIGHVRLADFTTEAWQTLLQHLRSAPRKRGEGLLSDAFIHGMLSKMRTVLRWAHARGMMEHLPHLSVPAANYARTVPPTQAEAELLLWLAPPHMKRVLVLGLFLGLRVGASELLALRWENVDLERAVVLVATSRKNKNAPWREVPINAALLDMFQEWQREDAAAGIEHVISYAGKPVASIKKAWATLLKRAGIERRIRPYDLRHAFASRLIEHGTDVGTVARLLGHSSPQMVFQHYQHISTDQKRAAVESLPPPSVWQAGMAKE